MENQVTVGNFEKLPRIPWSLKECAHAQPSEHAHKDPGKNTAPPGL